MDFLKVKLEKKYFISYICAEAVLAPFKLWGN